jgi:3-oxoacyl-[acyl-carrier-protein] synthase-3
LFKFAVAQAPDVAGQLCDLAGVEPGDIGWVILHQANLRIIQAIQKRIPLARERYAVNLDRFGNTSSPSLLAACIECMESGKMRPGDLVMMVGFGAGLTWAGMIVEW